MGRSGVRDSLTLLDDQLPHIPMLSLGDMDMVISRILYIHFTIKWLFVHQRMVMKEDKP
jgi:hypothetical protein